MHLSQLKHNEAKQIEHLISSPFRTVTPQHYERYQLEVGCFHPYTLACGSDIGTRSINMRLVSVQHILYTPTCDISRKKVFPRQNHHEITHPFLGLQEILGIKLPPPLLQGDRARHAKSDWWQAGWTTWCVRPSVLRSSGRPQYGTWPTAGCDDDPQGRLSLWGNVWGKIWVVCKNIWRPRPALDPFLSILLYIYECVFPTIGPIYSESNRGLSFLFHIPSCSGSPLPCMWAMMGEKKPGDDQSMRRTYLSDNKRN